MVEEIGKRPLDIVGGCLEFQSVSDMARSANRLVQSNTSDREEDVYVVLDGEGASGGIFLEVIFAEL